VRARLGLLGGFVAKDAQRHLAMPLRVQRLVAFLALGSYPLHRAYVAGRLWPDASQDQANGSLRATIWIAHRLRCPLIQVSSTHVALSPLVHVDVHELEDCATRVLRGKGQLAGEDLERLAHAGELLPDWYEDWVLQEREQLHELRQLALERAAERLLAAHRTSEASIAAFAAVNAEPLRESACYLLMLATIAAGNVAQAHRYFSTFDARLSELGLEPSPRIRELIAQPVHSAS
jgi:DNA-binding SARP family transcriptional activator